MNEFQSRLLNELVAVKITTKEEFEKVINFLSINNCFLVNGEPVVKLTYPGDKAFVILKQDNAIFWQPANQVLDERYKVVNVIEFFRPTEEEKVVEAKAEVIEEHVDIDEKHLSLEVQKRPANEAIVSNIDEMVKLIPAIEAKKGVVVDEKNYKDFVKAKTGMVPLYRSYAKKLETERKAVKKAYIEPYQEFEAKVNKVVKALNDTASVVAENVDVFVQKQKEALRKEMLSIVQKKASDYPTPEEAKSYLENMVNNGYISPDDAVYIYQVQVGGDLAGSSQNGYVPVTRDELLEKIGRDKSVLTEAQFNQEKAFGKGGKYSLTLGSKNYYEYLAKVYDMYMG